MQDALVKPCWLWWAFNTRLWKPTCSQWVRACNCIQKDEVLRIDRFVFKAPAISAMVGRLMLRKGISQMTGQSNAEIKLARTEEGRPALEGGAVNFDFNISHHGDWVVLALESQSRVGIDVMSLDRPINTDLAHYFQLMRRQFTDDEWRQINSSSNKLHEFYRFWCLKESYVKAVGVGLNMNLQTISFLTKDKIRETELTTSTQLVKSGSELKGNWLFEETLLDPNHCVTVCREIRDSSSISSSKNRTFTVVNIQDLLELPPLHNDSSLSTWENFNNKRYSNVSVT